MPHTRRGIKAEGRWIGPFASSPSSEMKGQILIRLSFGIVYHVTRKCIENI